MRWTPGCDSSDTTAGLAARHSTAAPPPRPRAPPRLSHWAAPAPLTRRSLLRRAQTQSCGQRRRGRSSTSIRFRFLEPPAEGEPSLRRGGRECLHYSLCLSRGRRETERKAGEQKGEPGTDVSVCRATVAGTALMAQRCASLQAALGQPFW